MLKKFSKERAMADYVVITPFWKKRLFQRLWFHRIWIQVKPSNWDNFRQSLHFIFEFLEVNIRITKQQKNDRNMSWTTVWIPQMAVLGKYLLSEFHLKDVNRVVEDEEDDKFQGTPFPIPNLIWMEASTQWSSWRRRRQISRHTISESHLKGDGQRSSWRRRRQKLTTRFVNGPLHTSKTKIFYLDYGVADEGVMEDQIYVLPEEWINGS